MVLAVACFLSTSNAFTVRRSKTLWCTGATATTSSSSSSSSLRMNFFDDVGDLLTGGKLEPQSSLPYDPPFCSGGSVAGVTRTFAVAERPLSFTGEDFDVKNADDGTDYLRVRGAMLHLPGKDKMRIRSCAPNDNDDEEVLVLDRVLVAATPTYDLYRGGRNAEKIGWIEKKLVALSDTFDVYMEGKGGFGVTGLFKPPPAYQITGDFLDRKFVMKNDAGQTVAKISEDGFIQFDAFNHYQVQVAAGMDAVLVLACTCAIDEEFDEEHQAKKEAARK